MMKSLDENSKELKLTSRHLNCSFIVPDHYHHTSDSTPFVSSAFNFHANDQIENNCCLEYENRQQENHNNLPAIGKQYLLERILNNNTYLICSSKTIPIWI